jgi:RNA polymerase sigma factor (sigma-70 family)
VCLSEQLWLSGFCKLSYKKKLMNPSESASKCEIIAATLREKRADFEAFVRRRSSAAEVGDILQTAALRAMERADSLDDPERAVAWLYRLHRNVIIDAGRKSAIERRVIDGASEAEAHAPEPADELCGCSISQAKSMEGDHASVLSLVDLGGLNLGEAARALDISTNNAAVRLHRARKALSRKMLDHCGVTSLSDCIDCRCVYDGCCAV